MRICDFINLLVAISTMTTTSTATTVDSGVVDSIVTKQDRRLHPLSSCGVDIELWCSYEASPQSQSIPCEELSNSIFYKDVDVTIQLTNLGAVDLSLEKAVVVDDQNHTEVYMLGTPQLPRTLQRGTPENQSRWFDIDFGSNDGLATFLVKVDLYANDCGDDDTITKVFVVGPELAPSSRPSTSPSMAPSMVPSDTPTFHPSFSSEPSFSAPSQTPSSEPSFAEPSQTPSFYPSASPSISDGSCCISAANDEGTVQGCNDSTCEAIVCALDDYCCTGHYDDECAELASSRCPICGGVRIFTKAPKTPNLPPSQRAIVPEAKDTTWLVSDPCGSYKHINLAIEYDTKFCEMAGESSKGKTEDFIKLLIQRLSREYFEVGGLCVILNLVHLNGYCNDNGDPYLALRDAYDIHAAKSIFNDIWEDKKEDHWNALHLLYWADHQDNTAGGLADVGEVGCSSHVGTGLNNYLVATKEQSIIVGDFIYENYPERFRYLVAHEVGHTLGAQHVDDPDDKGYLMKPTSPVVNTDLIERGIYGDDAEWTYYFSDEGKRYMVDFLGTEKANCVNTLQDETNNGQQSCLYEIELAANCDGDDITYYKEWACLDLPSEDNSVPSSIKAELPTAKGYDFTFRIQDDTCQYSVPCKYRTIDDGQYRCGLTNVPSVAEEGGYILSTRVVDGVGVLYDCVNRGAIDAVEPVKEAIRSSSSSGVGTIIRESGSSATNSPSMSNEPSMHPSPTPSVSERPSKEQSGTPTESMIPSVAPSFTPSASLSPSNEPSGTPTESMIPSVAPSSTPSVSFSLSNEPSGIPTASSVPSAAPSKWPKKAKSKSSKSSSKDENRRNLRRR